LGKAADEEDREERRNQISKGEESGFGRENSVADVVVGRVLI
jgi:hypothetical protein